MDSVELPKSSFLWLLPAQSMAGSYRYIWWMEVMQFFQLLLQPLDYINNATRSYDNNIS